MNRAVSDAAELPTTRTLLRTTLIAAAVAAALIVTVIMPAEYGVDPTGVGRLLGLTQMGKLKLQLLEEEADLQKSVAAAAASTETVSTNSMAQSDPSVREDSMTVTLTPAQHMEVKLVMTKDQVASYRWAVDSGAIYFDLHGEGPKSAGNPVQRYGEGTLRSAEGQITAAFNGAHGWYWENRTNHDVQVSVKAWGQFSELKKM